VNQYVLCIWSVFGTPIVSLYNFLYCLSTLGKLAASSVSYFSWRRSITTDTLCLATIRCFYALIYSASVLRWELTSHYSSPYPKSPIWQFSVTLTGWPMQLISCLTWSSISLPVWPPSIFYSWNIITASSMAYIIKMQFVFFWYDLWYRDWKYLGCRRCDGIRCTCNWKLI